MSEVAIDIDRAIAFLEQRRQYHLRSALRQGANDQISDPDATMLAIRGQAEGLFEAIWILRRRDWEGQ